MFNEGEVSTYLVYLEGLMRGGEMIAVRPYLSIVNLSEILVIRGGNSLCIHSFDFIGVRRKNLTQSSQSFAKAMQ